MGDDQDDGEIRGNRADLPEELRRFGVSLAPGILPAGQELDRHGVRASFEAWARESFELWHRHAKRTGPVWYADVSDSYPAERLCDLMKRFDAAKSIDALLALAPEHRDAIEHVLHSLVATAPNPAYDAHPPRQDALEREAAALDLVADYMRRHRDDFADAPSWLASRLTRHAALCKERSKLLRERAQPDDPHRRGGRKAHPLTSVLNLLHYDLPRGVGSDRLVAALASDFYGVKVDARAVGNRRRDQRRRAQRRE